MTTQQPEPTSTPSEWWTIDDFGNPVVEVHEPPDRRHPEKWTSPCPDGSPQRLCHPLGVRERNVGELELRVALGGRDGGVCDVIVDERDDEVYVRVFVCSTEIFRRLCERRRTALYASG